MSFTTVVALPRLLDLAVTSVVVTLVAGEDINANDVVSLHTDGKVYRASTTYSSVIGVAQHSARAGSSVRVLVAGVARVVVDGPVNAGDRLTISTVNPGRVVSYTGHSHTLSTTTGTAVSSVSPSTDTFVKSVTASTGTFVTGIPSTTGDDYGRYTVDSSGYLHHTHSIGSPSTATAVTGVSATTGTVVTSITASTDTFIKSASVGSGVGRVVGVALNSASTAGDAVTALILPVAV